MTKSKKVKVNYIDNKKFYEEIVKWRTRKEEAVNLGKTPPRMPDYLGECILKIAENVARHPKFMNYSYKDEMISDAIENCILYFDTFDPNKTKNPFAYFTQTVWYAFLRRIMKEKKERYGRYKMFEQSIIHSGGGDLLVDYDDNHVLNATIYDNINDFMKSFEEFEQKKKQKRKVAKEAAALTRKDIDDDRFAGPDIEFDSDADE